MKRYVVHIYRKRRWPRRVASYGMFEDANDAWRYASQGISDRYYGRVQTLDLMPVPDWFDTVATRRRSRE